MPRLIWERAPWVWANYKNPEEKKLWGKRITPWWVKNVFYKNLPNGSVRIAKKQDLAKSKKEEQDRVNLL